MVCKNCNKDKEEFKFTKTKKGIIHDFCITCRNTIYARNTRKRNPEKYNSYMRKWNKTNLNYKTSNVRQNRANYRARLINATPVWADIYKIDQIYKLASKLERELKIKLHVDHIEPLKGKNNSGLHIWWNLQILPKFRNQSKSNKIIENTTSPRVSDNFNEYIKEVENLCRTYVN